MPVGAKRLLPRCGNVIFRREYLYMWYNIYAVIVF